MPDPSSTSTLEAVSAARWRIAISLTIAMMVAYFGFILLVAFNKPLMGTRIAPGLSLGILLGAFVIVIAWTLTWIYIRWANTHYDVRLQRLRPPAAATAVTAAPPGATASRGAGRSAGSEGRR